MNDRNFTFIDLFAELPVAFLSFVADGGFIPVAHVEMNPYANDLKNRTVIIT